MELCGRADDMQRLREVARTCARIRLVGPPGVGRRALAAELVRLHGGAVEAGPVDVVVRVDGPDGERRFPVSPLGAAASGELLRARIGALDPTARDPVDDEAVAQLVERLGGLPGPILFAARLVAAHGPARTLALLADRCAASLLEADPTATRWLAAMDALLAEAPAAARALESLCVFPGAFDHDAAEAVHPGAVASLGWLIERGLARTRPPDGWILGGEARAFAAARLAARGDAPEMRLRHARWALDASGDGAPSPAVASSLRAVFFGDDHPRLAREAGARLSPHAADHGPVRAHLARLLALDAELGEPSVEAECAIARLHLLLAEPERAWRRIARHLDRDERRGEIAHLAGNALRRLGRADEAAAAYARAIAALELDGTRRELGLALSNLGGLCVERGDAAGARAAWSRALRCFALEGDPRREAVTLGDLGLLDHEAGDLEAAGRRYRRALALHEEYGNARFVGIVSADLGELELTRGDPIAARALLERSVAQLAAVNDARQALLAEAALALAEAWVGEDGAARLDRVRDRAPADLVPVMRLYAAGLRIADARRARASGDRAAERDAIEAVEAALAEATGEPDEARRVEAALRAELARHRRASGWLIAPDASFFVTPEEDRVDLSRRHVQRRLLEALLTQRLSAPGAALGLEALLRHGWPGQRVLRDAARNRLHVALSGLRKAGLEPLLLKESDGYLLDPAVEVVVAR